MPFKHSSDIIISKSGHFTRYVYRYVPVPKKIQNSSRNSRNSRTMGHPERNHGITASPSHFSSPQLRVPHQLFWKFLNLPIKPNFKSSTPLPVSIGEGGGGSHYFLLLYLLKTSENRRFSVLRGYRSGTLAENGLP